MLINHNILTNLDKTMRMHCTLGFSYPGLQIYYLCLHSRLGWVC